jgi:hypothetical protein
MALIRLIYRHNKKDCLYNVCAYHSSKAPSKPEDWGKRDKDRCSLMFRNMWKHVVTIILWLVDAWRVPQKSEFLTSKGIKYKIDCSFHEKHNRHTKFHLDKSDVKDNATCRKPYRWNFMYFSIQHIYFRIVASVEPTTNTNTGNTKKSSVEPELETNKNTSSSHSCECRTGTSN